MTSFSVPAQTNTVFAEPELADWPALVEANRGCCRDVRHRQRHRAELLGQAAAFTAGVLGGVGASPQGQGAVVVAGHQPVWHHCGIWVKDAVCSALAGAVAGTGVHVVLDHDIRETVMTVPIRRANGTWRRRSLYVEAPDQAVTLEQRRPPVASLARFVHQVMGVDAGQFCNAIWEAQRVADRATWGRFQNLAEAITYLQAMLHAALGQEDLLYLPVSRLSASAAFTEFVASVLSDAVSFAAFYNEAIAAASARAGADAVRRLAVHAGEGTVELPFWLVGDGKRTPLVVRRRRTGAFTVGTACDDLGDVDAGSFDDRAAQLRALLRRRCRQVRPKAVSLTLFLRLYLADWFVHGVGGAAYEPITDRLISRYYGVRPSRYGVVTCSATLPRCRSGGTDVGQASRLRHRLHHVRHNPECGLTASQLRAERTRRLVGGKRRAITAASNKRLSHAERHAAWESIAVVNRQLRQLAGGAIARLERATGRAEGRTAARAVCDSREYFFGLFPEKELRAMVGAIRAQVGGGADGVRGTPCGTGAAKNDGASPREKVSPSIQNMRGHVE